jgi:hypothetical protein
MTDTDQGLYERDLTPAEIEERKALNLDLQGERDQNLADISQFRSQIRKLNAANKRLEMQSAQVRHEIRSGKVLESRQVKLAFGVEPIEPGPLAAVKKLYPLATNHGALHTQLSVILQGVLVPSIEKLERWGTSSGIFDAIATWASIEFAYINRKEHPDLDLPERKAMPVKLAELRGELQRAADAARKGRKPSKPRPASGTPIAKQPRRRK